MIGQSLPPKGCSEHPVPECRLQEDEIEIGLGIHGEPGASKRKAAPAKEVVNEVQFDPQYQRTATVARGVLKRVAGKEGSRFRSLGAQLTFLT